MDRILARVNNDTCLADLDDIIVFVKTWKHRERLKRVFLRVHQSDIKVNPLKCRLALDRVPFLGHIVSWDGVSPGPALI